MAISQEGHLIVAQQWLNNCITVINTDSGHLINRSGQPDSLPVEFRSPEGLSLTQNGHIIVADFFNHHLEVLTVEGAFVTLTL